jgi:hypothetical protein
LFINASTDDIDKALRVATVNAGQAKLLTLFIFEQLLIVNELNDELLLMSGMLLNELQLMKDRVLIFGRFVSKLSLIRDALLMIMLLTFEQFVNDKPDKTGITPE